MATEADIAESQRLARLTRDNVFGKISDEGAIPGETYAEGQIIVQYVPGTSQEEKDRIASKYGLTFSEDDLGDAVVYLYDATKWPNIYDLIRAVWGENMGPWNYGDDSGPYTGSVQYAQPQFIYRIAGGETQRNLTPGSVSMSVGAILGIALVIGVFMYANKR